MCKLCNICRNEITDENDFVPAYLTTTTNPPIVFGLFPLDEEGDDISEEDDIAICKGCLLAILTQGKYTLSHEFTLPPEDDEYERKDMDMGQPVDDDEEDDRPF